MTPADLVRLREAFDHADFVFPTSTGTKLASFPAGQYIQAFPDLAAAITSKTTAVRF